MARHISAPLVPNRRRELSRFPDGTEAGSAGKNRHVGGVGRLWVGRTGTSGTAARNRKAGGEYKGGYWKSTGELAHGIPIVRIRC